MNARWWSVGMIALTLAVGLLTRLRALPTAPAKLDPAQAQLWMADSLPGIGAKRLEPTLAAIRGGHVGSLPKPAREAAKQVFSLPDVP